MIELKTPKEVQDINADLHLFDEPDWNFLDVVNQDNAEYFNDVRDFDFADDGVLTKRVKFTVPFVVIACLSIIVMSVAVTVNNLTDKNEYQTIASVKSEEDFHSLPRVEGTSTSNTEQIACGRVLTGYFGSLGKFDKASLQRYISDSSILNTYNSFQSSINYNYDNNDCSARILKSFAEQCSLSSVNDVIKVGDKYYCYVSIKAPTKDRVTEYVHSIRYVLMKKFHNNKPSRGTVIPYIVSLMEKEPIADKNQEYCFIIQGNKITDDSNLYSDITTGYEYMLSEVEEIVQTKLAK